MDIKDFFYKSKVENFVFYKQKLLGEIASIGKYSFIDNVRNKISNCDYHLNPSMERKYKESLKKIIPSHLQLMCEELNFTDYKIHNIWFQQYESGDYFNTHNHIDCNFSHVLYLELPNKKMSTQFFWKQKNFSIDVEEGDILSFPSFLPHCSPENTGIRKTIIAFNADLLF